MSVLPPFDIAEVNVHAVALIRKSRKEFPWKEWAAICWEYHVGIINWPHGVPWPGSAINVRGLYTDELKLLISRERVNEALALHARPPLADTELEDHVYPTIVALDGTFFLVVS